MKLGSSQRRPRRPAGGGQPRPRLVRGRRPYRPDPAGGARRLGPVAPQLELLATDLAHDVIPRERFHEREAAAPLPRAYQWADGSAYVNHVALVRQARGGGDAGELLDRSADVPGRRPTRCSAPRDPIPLADEAWGCDSRRRWWWSPTTCRAASRPRRRWATSCWSAWSTTSRLRNLIPAELGKGFGFLQSKPASALSPVFVTPDELGERLQGRQAARRAQGRPQRRAVRPGRRRRGHDLRLRHPDRPSREDPEPRRRHDHRLGHRLEPRCRTAGRASRSTAAAAAIPASPRSGRSRPSSTASRETPFLKRGDTVRIWMDDEHGHPIFGAIEQTVA